MPLTRQRLASDEQDLRRRSTATLRAADPAPAAAGAPRRWSINGDFLGLAPTGVARYAREVTLALDRLFAEAHPLTAGVELDIIAAGHGRAPLDLAILPVRVVPEFSRPRLPQFWVQAQLPRHVPGGLLSFCNLAPILLRRHIVCIHDMQTRLVPESYGRMFRLAHTIVLPMLGRRAAAITTVSELSRRHLIELGVSPAGKITVTYNGSDHVSRWDARRGTLPPPQRPYVLCLGRSERHKNLALLVRLAPLLDARGLDLWMAGEVDAATVRDLSPGQPAGNLRLLGRISDDDFGRALSNAVCFLFPSRSEGFGLPAIEAMACGCPVVCSTSACMPEICGDAALFADPDDLDGWAKAVTRLQSTPSLRASLIRSGTERAAHYQWSRIAETYLELMRAIDNSHASPKKDSTWQV